MVATISERGSTMVNKPHRIKNIMRHIIRMYVCLVFTDMERKPLEILSGEIRPLTNDHFFHVVSWQSIMLLEHPYRA